MWQANCNQVIQILKKLEKSKILTILVLPNSTCSICNIFSLPSTERAQTTRCRFSRCYLARHVDDTMTPICRRWVFSTALSRLWPAFCIQHWADEDFVARVFPLPVFVCIAGSNCQFSAIVIPRQCRNGSCKLWQRRDFLLVKAIPYHCKGEATENY